MRKRSAAAKNEPAVLPGVTVLPVWEQGMNPEQLAAIRHGAGPLQNVAQAGSGKTRAVVHRVARLVHAEQVPPERIFCVTFSRKAAEEMETRLGALGVPGASVQTWHAFCYRVLREDQTRYSTWTIDEKNRAKGLMKETLGYKHLNWKGADLGKVLRFVGICKAKLLRPDAPEALADARKQFGGQAQMAVRAYSTWQGLVEDAGLLTFDDMLLFTWEHLQDEQNRASWAARFDYVIQDEGQDSSPAQDALAEMLARDHKNYMVVGDPAQSIYSFRGSSPRVILEFQNTWGGERVAMCRNYRSGRAIVAFANDVIRPAAVRLPEDMIAERDADGKVDVVPAANLEDEAREFVSFAKGLIEEGKRPSDVCCLFRTNAQSRSLEDALLAAKVPYIIVGGTCFYERKEVKDILAYLRVACRRDKDGDAVKRCINAPFRFLGAKFVERVGDHAARMGETPDYVEAVLCAAQDAGIQSRQVTSAKEWASLVKKVECDVVDGKSPREILSDIVSATRYVEWLEKEEGEESIESSQAANVRELVRVADAFASAGDLLAYVDKSVTESARQRRTGRGRDCVTLMSIHRSKGLEWPYVWVVGCNEQILPHVKGDPEEERRLMYVACTRARDHLVVSYVHEMALRSGVREVDRSRFLDFLEAVPEQPAPGEGGDEDTFAALIAGEDEVAQIESEQV